MDPPWFVVADPPDSTTFPLEDEASPDFISTAPESSTAFPVPIMIDPDS